MSEDFGHNEDLKIALAKANGLPKVASEDIEDGDTELRLFGENFSRIFAAMLEEARGPKLSGVARHYLDSAERFGNPWNEFVAENGDLIQEIYVLLDDHKTYMDLLRRYIDLGILVPNERKEAFTQGVTSQVDPVLGFQAIQIPLFKALNVLLQKAAAKLHEKGIDVEKDLSF